MKNYYIVFAVVDYKGHYNLGRCYVKLEENEKFDMSHIKEFESRIMEGDMSIKDVFILNWKEVD